MFTRTTSKHGLTIRRKQQIKLFAVLLIVCGLIVLAIIGIHNWKRYFIDERHTMLNLWDQGKYDQLIELTNKQLVQQPLNTFYLTIQGFSAFQLALAQITAEEAQKYLDICICSLRKVLLSSGNHHDARIPYVLGKAYYHKGTFYADLAVRYLEQAMDAHYSANDIPEYLGLSYVNIHDYRNSIAAFSQALTIEKPSDILLLAIAQSYIALEEETTAKAYLLQCMESSKDAIIISKARLELGKIYQREGKSTDAEAQYLAILAENDQNADAHFQLGELYAASGDLVKARAEWRKTIRIDPNYEAARSRLSM
jgi:tetratricopeptide (TPR) repeat protein